MQTTYLLVTLACVAAAVFCSQCNGGDGTEMQSYEGSNTLASAIKTLSISSTFRSSSFISSSRIAPRMTAFTNTITSSSQCNAAFGTNQVCIRPSVLDRRFTNRPTSCPVNCYGLVENKNGVNSKPLCSSCSNNGMMTSPVVLTCSPVPDDSFYARYQSYALNCMCRTICSCTSPSNYNNLRYVEPTISKVALKNFGQTSIFKNFA